MPKGDSKGRRGDDESNDDDVETQSVASYSSTPGTHSGDEADVIDEGVDVDFEDGFEQALAENIDSATQKRKETIVDCIERCLKRGSREDRVLGSSIAVLLCVQLGAGSDGEIVFKTLKPHFITVIQDQTAGFVARGNCASALALCCFIASEDSEELYECSGILEGIFDNKKTVKPDEVPLYNNALLAWALLLSVTPLPQAYSLINKHLRRVMFLLQTSNLGVRIVAGELLALMYEVGRSVQHDFGYRDRNGVCDSIRELATEGTKHIAKKDLRQQRSSFRDILKTIEDGIPPRETIKFGSECIELDSWVQRRRYSALKEVLGTGENDLLRDIFDLGPPLKPSEAHRVSRYQRQLHNAAVAKARTLMRGKNRDKRNAWNVD
ncbi:Interferon-related developmental regulator 1 [Acropora cervicornis]|uniref:Interferon-related developmental regulator 1 n=1 Tax=Acropora cervicornis TaxID=6130 RepID=A0AAD9QLL1_ACRCE|nr:Interferon-related developmental regulator 1 [Acropora cervicornis]